MLLPRQRDLYIKEYGSDFSRPSRGIYLEDKNDSYNDTRYQSTLDSAPNRKPKKINFHYDNMSDDLSRAPTSVLKNRASVS